MLFTTRFLLTGTTAVLALPGTVHGLFHYGGVNCPTLHQCTPPDCVPGEHDKFDVILPIGQGCSAALGPGVEANRDGQNRIVGTICGVEVTITPGKSFTASNGQSGQCFSYGGGSNTVSRCGTNCVFSDGGWCNSGICG